MFKRLNCMIAAPQHHLEIWYHQRLWWTFEVL
jgi:hypothetical protein